MIRRAERIIDNFSHGLSLKDAVFVGRFFNKQEVYIFSSQAKSQLVDAMRNYLDVLESNLNLFVIVISQSVRFALYLIIICMWIFAVYIYYHVIVIVNQGR